MRKYPFIQVRRTRRGAVFFVACIALFALIAAAGVLVHVQSMRMRSASTLFSAQKISSKIDSRISENISGKGDAAHVERSLHSGLADDLAEGIQIGIEADAVGTAILSSGLNGLLFSRSDFSISAPLQASAGAQGTAVSGEASAPVQSLAAAKVPTVQASKAEVPKVKTPKNVQQNVLQPVPNASQDAVPVRGASSRGYTIGAAFYLFVVLDDAGAALSQLDAFYQFPEFDNLTMSILPRLRNSQEIAEALDARGAAYIVHMPMQPVGSEDPGPGALMAFQDSDTIRRISDENLASFPNSIGTNNHMGSYATSDERIMGALLGTVKERGLFFMDSVTTAKSAASRAAAKEGVRIITRDVFLDNEPTVQSTLAQLRSMARLARSRGFAVAIGHVTKPTTARALALFYDEVIGQGGAFASLKDYFDITASLAPPASAASSASSNAKGKSNYN